MRFKYRFHKMPPKRQNIGRRTRRTNQSATARRNEDEEQRTQRTNAQQRRQARQRANQTNEERQLQNMDDQLRMARNRNIRDRTDANRSQQNFEARILRQNHEPESLLRAAFHYNHEINYSLHTSVVIGTMNKVCVNCKALKFKNEAPGLCCVNGKVKLPPLNIPPEPLRTLVTGTTSQSKQFLKNIQSYNACFQMTSFGATSIVRDNFMPTFKVISTHGVTNSENNQYNTNNDCETFTSSDNTSYNFSTTSQIQGQIYHRAGSLLPFADANYQFLQIYFMGNASDELNQRCAISSNTRREIVEPIQKLLHEHNALVRLFKTAIDQMPSDNHRIVIRADKAPAAEHADRFNAPTIDEVAIVIVGEQFQSRDIVLHRRTNELQRISETHRSYDALQYPILFWQGDDGYHFNIKMINPTNGKFNK